MKTIKTIGILGIIAVLAFAAFALSAPAVQNIEQTAPVVTTDVASVVPDNSGVTKIGYDGYVTIKKFEAATGEWKTVEDSKHNLITQIGINRIKAKLNGTDVTAANNLTSVSLSADSGAGIASTYTQLVSEIAANGLSRNGTATWSQNGTGGFNVTAQWTATNSQSAASTGLQWSSTLSSDNNLFAALAFTQQDLLINDQLQVIWQIVIS